jgi:hypothetical protein
MAGATAQVRAEILEDALPRLERGSSRDVSPKGAHEAAKVSRGPLAVDNHSKNLIRIALILAVFLLATAVLMPPPVALFSRMPDTLRLIAEITVGILTVCELAAGILLTARSNKTR